MTVGLALVATGLAVILRVIPFGNGPLAFNIASPVLAVIALWGSAARQRSAAIAASVALLVGLNARRVGLSSTWSGGALLVGGTIILALRADDGAHSRGLMRSTIPFGLIALAGVLVALVMPLIMHALGY